MRTIIIEPKVLDYPTSTVNNIDIRIDKKEFEIFTEDCTCIIDEVEFVKIIDLETKMPLPVVDTPQPTTTATPRKGIHKFVSRMFNRLAVLPLTLPLCLVLVMGVGSVWGQTTITQWNFDASNLTPNTGSGTATNVGGTSSAFATGSSGQGWNTAAYPASGNSANNKTAGVQFAVSTSGYQNIQLSYSHRGSNTAANSSVVQYTLDVSVGSPTWIDMQTFTVTPASSGAGDTWFSRSVNFSSVAGLNNNPNAAFRIVSAHASGNNYVALRSTSTYSTSGTWRFDNVTISGTIIPSNYNVTYNGNSNSGGTAPTDATNYSSGATVTVLGNTGSLARTGYTFAGWNTLANGSGTDRAAGSTFTISANTTLFAKWTANSNTITFDGNGATGGTTASQNINTAASANLTANGFLRTGYTFAGWNTASNGTGTSYADQANYTMGTANVTLYVQWTANTLTITYDSQGGSSISNGSTTTGGSVSNPGNPTQSGYSFNGWFVASSGGSAISFPYTHGQTANFILYAQWTVASTPTIDPVTLASALSTTYGTASSGISFTASGSNLSANITATAQSGYEVSTLLGSGYGSSVAVSSGTTIYVRFTATQAAGTYDNATAVVLSSTGATSQNVTTSSSSNTVSQKGLTITGITISNKTYDATTTAIISGTAAYSGLVNSESFSVTGSPTAVFNNKNVGTAKPITVSGYTAPSANYSVTQPTGLTADITAKALTVTSPAVTSKTYDGTANATITGTLSGVESGDVVTLTGTGTFASANVGTGINVTSTSSLGGANAGNYSLTQPTGLTGNITSKALTITANDVTKEMGQVLSGGAGSTAFSSSGLVGSETIGSVTISYGAAGGATGQGATLGTYANQVTPSAATAGSFNASNYSITYASGAIIVGGFTAGNLVVERIGDGSTTLSSAASAINLFELNPSGSTIQTLSSLFTSTNLLTETGTGTSNGYLNSYNSILGVPGYNSALATASIASSNTKATNIIGTGASVTTRVVFPTSGSPLPFTSNNFRSIIPTSATTFYASGAGSSSTGGIWYYDGSAFTQVSTTVTNTRNVEIFNGNLYFSTGSATAGIYQVGTGLPTTSGQTATLIAATGSPYGFSISPDGNTMYVADDGVVSGNTGGGIQKWTKSGGTWIRQYTYGTQARGIMVDYSGSNAVVYATTTETSSNKIIKIIDTGSGATSSDVLTAGSNYVFRGVDFTPAAAPSAPTIGTVTQPTCATATGSIELTGLPSGQWRIYGTPSGSAVGTGSSTTISGLSAGSYTFLVTSYTGRTSVASSSVTINAQPGAPGIPSAPTASAQSLCSGATVADLTVTSGSSIKWYDAETDGNLLAAETALSSTTYYASQTVSGCESSRTIVAVTINSTGTWIGEGETTNWTEAANWCGGVPDLASESAIIPSGVEVTVNASPTILAYSLASGSTVNLGSNTITIANGGSFTNNGTFNSQTGTVAFAGTGTLSGSATTFNNLTVSGALTVSTSPTVNGTVTINNGGSITTNPIIYGASATLVYDQGGSITSTANEWPTSSAPHNVTLQNSSNVTLNGAKTINGVLTLTNGKLTLGSNHLTLGLNATIGGTPSASNMIIASGDGELRKRFSAANLDAFTFPVGTGTSYTPVVLDFNSGTFGTDAYMRVRVKNEKSSFLNSNVTTYLNRNWIVEPFDITGYSYKVQLHYVDADFVTDGSLAEGNLLPIKISSGQWYQPTDGSFTNAEEQGFAGVFANSNFLEWDGLTTFSEFGGAGGSNQPLPVELLSFNASCVEDQNILTWQTASEHNSSHFDIEKSRDGETWDVIGQQTAAGNSTELLSYQFVDAEKNNATLYYRLNQVDVDGKNEYFGPVALDCDKNYFEASTLPNPSNGNFWIKIQSNEVSSAKLKLVDVKGDVLLTNDISIQEGINVYPVSHLLESGMYFIHIENSKDQKITVLKHLQN